MKVRWQFDPKLWAVGVHWAFLHPIKLDGTMTLRVCGYLPCLLVTVDKQVKVTSSMEERGYSTSHPNKEISNEGPVGI